jgi:hypothetical protein
MSWSDDTRCLHCDGKLPLYRKITSGQFCSAAHRKAYWHEQEKLAVERLHQTHDSLRAYRPAEALEPAPRRAPLREPDPAPNPVAQYAAGPAAAELSITDPNIEDFARSASNTGRVTMGGFVSQKPSPRMGNAPSAASTLDFAAYPVDVFSLPAWLTGIIAGEWATAPRTAIPFFDAVEFASASRPAAAHNAPDPLVPSVVAGSASLGIRFTAAPETPEFAPEFVAGLLAQPAAVEPEPASAIDVVAAEPVVAFSASLLALSRIASRTGAFAPRIDVREMPYPARNPLAASSVRMPGIEGRSITPVAPRLVPLALTAAPRRQGTQRTVAEEPRAVDLVRAAGALPIEIPHPTLTLVAAKLVPLALTGGPRRQGTQRTVAEEPQAVDLVRAAGAPPVEIPHPALMPALRLAPGSRYRMSNGRGSVARGTTPQASESRLLALNVNDLRIDAPSATAADQPEFEPVLAARCRYTVSIRPRSIETARVRASAFEAIEAHPIIAIAGLPRGWGETALEPVFPRLRPLAFHATPRPPQAARPVVSSVLPLYPDNPPLLPVARWTPLDGDPIPPPRIGLLGGWLGAMSQARGTGDAQQLWSQAADFWQHAPRDLKLLAIALPVLLGLALRPSLPKVRVTAPAKSVAVAGSFGRDFEARMMNVRRNVADRAGVELNDDFRAGLDDWQSRGDLSTAWSFDPNGFVKPGALALYRPSMNLTDYQMEFLGLIDKKALSWVARAADFDNYYVIKLVVLKPGPMPTIGITRYAVIHGKAQNRVDNVAAINARTDMLYRVNLTVRDDTYLLTLQGTVVDTWSESRLTAGGIGFFSQPGEESRLRWVQVTHQYDMLGRLCAYLAPYNIQTTNGSW